MAVSVSENVTLVDSASSVRQPPELTRLEDLAGQLAQSHSQLRLGQAATPLLDQLKDHEALLQAAYNRFAQASKAELVFSYAAEWLLDNFYVVRQALRQIREDMPRGYYRQLPKFKSGPLSGYPRIYDLARVFIREATALVDIGQLRAFINAYQVVAPLTLGEIWGLPIMLLFGLIEDLSAAIGQLTQLALPTASAGPAPSFPAGTEETIVANCIISLRTMATEDWKIFFEDVSLVEQSLRRDPSQVYGRMDFDTRDRYRKIVEKLALATGRSEFEVARATLELAQRNPRERERRRHVGYYLIDAGQAELETHLGYRVPAHIRGQRWLFKHATWLYLGSLAALTGLCLVLLGDYAWAVGRTSLAVFAAVALALIPTSSVAVIFINWIITHVVSPRVLPRLDFESTLPIEYSTIVVMPALIGSREEVSSLLQQIEMHYLRNAVPNLYFALLTDFADAPAEQMPNDAELIQLAIQGVTALNAKYGHATPAPFFLAHRRRQWNAAESAWLGWERKRGKLHEFNQLLRGSLTTSFTTVVGDRAVLERIQYVITVDADTVIPRGSARRLIGTLAHPLNRAEFAPATDEIIAGYSILQPRTEINPQRANQSLFTRIFAGDRGLDLYTLAVSDVYQDLFGEGIYVGKGIYDVDAFERSLRGRVSENSLLSHDLFEGIHGRVGLVTNITLLEDYPPHYLAKTRRSHRWIRGDWQLLPWLFSSQLSAIDRWKVIDNLRRSLAAPAQLALFLAGWIGLPGQALTWTLIGLLLLSGPFAVSVLDALIMLVRSRTVEGALRPLRYDLARWFLTLAFLPYEAWLALTAIVVTLVRLLITRRHLLQWVTAARTVRMLGHAVEVEVTTRHMLVALLASIGSALGIYLTRPAALPVAVPVLIIWMLSPLIAYWISRPLIDRPQPLPAEQQNSLRVLARHTWLFFERFVGPDDNWLPPDHFQETPRGLPAHRTSPTNIGLFLLSMLGAYDLGYIGLVELALRVRDTFDTLMKLERHRGHWLNWYDTRNLQPLVPAYVSTVDSGNLAACLLVLKQALIALPQTGVLRWQRRAGLLDTLALLNQNIADLSSAAPKLDVTELQDYLNLTRQRILEIGDQAAPWLTLVADLTTKGWPELNRRLMAFIEPNVDWLEADMLRSLRLSADRLHHHLEATQREVDVLLPWLLPLYQPPAFFTDPATPEAVRAAWQDVFNALPASLQLTEIIPVSMAGRIRLQELDRRIAECALSPEQTQAAGAWCLDLDEKLEAARLAIEPLLIGYAESVKQADEFFLGIDFRFLFNAQRKVFHIGYNVTSDQLDNNFYDLLASEARIASLVAIAKRDVPQSHWLQLGRPFTQVAGVRTLLSWSGTLFEYLMPGLFMRSDSGTLLNQSVRAAVDYQIAYGRQKKVPWGISESGYYHFDAAQNYQYRAFGAPALGFKRGLAEDLVVAPYASLMALGLRPKAVADNLEHLRQLHMLSHFGLYEAIDFTASRLPPDQPYAIIRAYMAHHQGMIMLALTNYLGNNLMLDRFHAEPLIQSIDLLLQEQIPLTAPVEFPQNEEAPTTRPLVQAGVITSWPAPIDAPVPQVHLLSNGRYTVLLSSAGSGNSRWQDMDLTRWHADTTLDDGGTWLYLKDLDNAARWSAAFQPVGQGLENQGATFYPHMAEFHAQFNGVATTLEVTIAPDEDVEVRCLTVVNHSDQVRHLRLTSYGEVVLAPAAVDQRHPAFNKLFIESEYVPHFNAQLFHRRPRSKEEKPVFLVHMLVAGRESKLPASYEPDRQKFLGRGGTVRSPAALDRASTPSGSVGDTLDPILSLSQTLELKPHASLQVAYLTLVHPTREGALNLAQRYRAWHVITHTFDQARTRSEIELRQLVLTGTELQRYQQLLGVLLYPHPRLRAEPAVLMANTRGQSSLWAYGLSGDYPILLVQIADDQEVAAVAELLRAHAYWRERQIKIDLVILNTRESGYAQEVKDQLQRLLAQTKSESWLNQRGGIFVLNAQYLSEADQVLLYTAARAVLRGKESLAERLRDLLDQPVRLPAFIPTLAERADREPTPPLARPLDLRFDNGDGGFSPDGREYVIYLRNKRLTPLPWINVMANPEFGSLVSESGGGYSWSINSSENRLTPWRNDPVSDTPGEIVYLRDEETGQVWSPTPLPAGEVEPYLIRHGAGYSIFQHHSHGLKQQVQLFVAAAAPVKVIRVRLENAWKRMRRITVTYYAEWVLGVTREEMQPYIMPEFDNETHALLARNPYHTEFGGRVAFLAASKAPHGLTTDRAEFLGRLGSYQFPAALSRIGLAGSVVAGLDPCAALMLHIDLPPGESEEIYFLLGQGADRAEALQLIKQYQIAAEVERAWDAVRQHWDEILGTITVHTPDPALDLLLNRWLLYQSLACRMWGRSALYQSSGAFGFRDQLQDVMAYVHALPHVTRTHILEAARHQFEAGDVLHWWHPPSGRGLRTRCSDDLVWLPYVTAHYVAATGDRSILSESLPFLRARPLETEEAERYGQYESTTETYSLYEHCRRALKKGLTSGPHGLPLMGAGDWNDGMNHVGAGGRGESVWLGWFLYDALMKFAPLCEMQSDDRQAQVYRQQARDLQQALEAQAWDGAWYRRAYYDDGTPLGSSQNRECQIDSIAQSWAVLSHGAKPDRARQAMEAVDRRLVRETQNLILLLTPPFDQTRRDPGYIRGYLPGIRENGGQYTHAALWSVWAFAELGLGNRANHLFRLLNPIEHSRTSNKIDTYQVEPYVIAADVYDLPAYLGHGGWTWYTGSASWMYRLGVEALLGLKREGQQLRMKPCIPNDWRSYEMTYRYKQTLYHIQVENSAGVEQGVVRITLDGTPLSGDVIPLEAEGGLHQVRVEMGRPA